MLTLRRRRLLHHHGTPLSKNAQPPDERTRGVSALLVRILIPLNCLITRNIRAILLAILAGILSLLYGGVLAGQSRPLPDKNVQLIYKRLLAQIQDISIFDDHAHPGFSGDPDVDAMASPPGHPPFRVLDSNPEWIAAAKSLFNYPFGDFSAPHAAWLLRQTTQRSGTAYWNQILDKCGIRVSLANRAAMAAYLDPARFHWVFFVDSFLFPFDNRYFRDRNPDEAVYIPLQEKMLHRYMHQAGLARLPDTLSAYLSFADLVVTQNKDRGGVAMKFEAAYFRSLYFADPPRAQASAVYRRYCHRGVPSPQEYKEFQDYVFRHLVREAGRLKLPVNIHSAVGGGDYFSLHNGNVLNLENVLRDPRYAKTTFVLLHGGYPYDRQIIWLAAMPNVYIDSSEIELLLYPSQFSRILQR